MLKIIDFKALAVVLASMSLMAGAYLAGSSAGYNRAKLERLQAKQEAAEAAGEIDDAVSTATDDELLHDIVRPQ